MKKQRFIQATFILLIFICGTTAFAVPVNDKYQNALVTTLDQPLVEFEGTTFGATKEAGEPYHARNAGGNSVWYRVVPQETAVVRIYISATSAGNYFNTLLAVYKGSAPSDFNLMAENDDMGYTTMSDVTVTLKPGNIYYVAIDGYNNDGNIATGNFRLRFEKLGAPLNDSPIIGPHMRFRSQVTGFAAGTNRNATKEADEPDLTANAGGKSVWYAWTAPESRVMTVRLTCNSFAQECFQMQLGVFKGGLNNKIGANDDYDNNPEVSSVSFFAEEGETYAFGIDGFKLFNLVTEGNFLIEFFPADYRYETNFDATDRKADLSVFRPGDGVWYTMHSSNNQPGAVQFGLAGDVPVPADYDGDAVSDYAVVRNTPGGAKVWYFLLSATGSFQAITYGLADDKPLAGDYDADGRADMVAVRPTAQNLVWYIRPSNTPNSLETHVFGLGTDQPVIGNFVTGLEIIGGRQATDLAVVRADANGKKTWYIQSTSGTNYKQIQFGLASDVNVPADYDRDGYTDIAVWRPATGDWFIYDESLNKVTVRKWGQSGDIPVAANLDGTGAPELSIFRPSTGDWWIYSNGGAGSTSVIHWGAPGDIPTAGPTDLMN